MSEQETNSGGEGQKSDINLDNYVPKVDFDKTLSEKVQK